MRILGFFILHHEGGKIPVSYTHLYRLDVPQVTELAYELQQAGVKLPDGILETEELVRELCRLR